MNNFGRSFFDTRSDTQVSEEQKDLIKEFTRLSPTPTYELYLRYCMFHGVQPVSREEYLEAVYDKGT